MKIHHLQGYIQSIYLVEYTDRLLLLDGCCRADISRLQKFIEQDLNRKFSDLKLLVVTHMHPDHAGGAHKLRDLSGCKIASADVPSHWYGGFMGAMMHLTDLLLTLFVGSRMKRPLKNVWYPRKLKMDYRMKDGETLPGFDEWLVWETFGHTDRDLTLVHEPTWQAYVGDVVLKIKGKFIPPFPIFHPNKYRASLQRYVDSDMRQLLLAHGGPVDMTTEELNTMVNNAPKKPKTYLRFIHRSASKYISRR